MPQSIPITIVGKIISSAQGANRSATLEVTAVRVPDGVPQLVKPNDTILFTGLGPGIAPLLAGYPVGIGPSGIVIGEYGQTPVINADGSISFTGP